MNALKINPASGRMKKKLFLLSIAFVFTLSGCTKFEEGPFITIKTNKQRIAQTWVIEAKYDVTTGDPVTFEEDLKLIMSKDGTFAETDCNVPIEGTWLFSGDDNIIYSYSSSMGMHCEDTYRIIKLFIDEFWIIDDNYEIHYKPY